MDAYVSHSQNRDNFFDPPPILIVADDDLARARACRTVTAAGRRVADVVGLDAASERIRRQVSASALWVELDSYSGAQNDALLHQIAADASEGRYGVVVAASAELLDRLGQHALNTDVDVIIDADESERVAALAVAISKHAREARVSDATADKNAARLRQLSDEVSRIASTLARLSTGPSTTSRPIQSALATDAPPVSADAVRSVISARRLRARYFPENLFADPAWDMLLDLLQAEVSQLRVPVSSLCIAAAVPPTTALRWLKTLVEEGIFVRRADPHDGRRVFVELAPESSRALRRYFAEIGQAPVI
jgi:hypothetical protein